MEKIFLFYLGSVLTEVKRACIELKSKIYSTLLNIKTIKPIDKSIISNIKKYKKIVIIEEHTKIGGLNEIISDLIIKNNIQDKNIKYIITR